MENESKRQRLGKRMLDAFDWLAKIPNDFFMFDSDYGKQGGIDYAIDVFVGTLMLLVAMSVPVMVLWLIAMFILSHPFFFVSLICFIVVVLYVGKCKEREMKKDKEDKKDEQGA